MTTPPKPTAAVREWANACESLDGMVSVNLAEPSAGDLERVFKAYVKCKSDYNRAIALCREMAAAINDNPCGCYFGTEEHCKSCAALTRAREMGIL